MKITEMHIFKRRIGSLIRLCLFFALLSYVSSCVPAKKVVYFHNLKEDSTYPAELVQKGAAHFTDPKILPNDILAITVQTEAQNESNAPTAVGTSSGSSDISGFLVDKDGFVQYALIGYIKVGGLTTSEAGELIKQKAKEYYKNPVVNVRIINFEITVTGDVGKPGKFTVPSEKANIIDAIAMTGDLNITAKRDNILLARTEGDETKFVRLDLTSSEIFNSPYFYLRQRDIIYVEPNHYKNQTGDNSLTRIFGYSSGLVALVSLLFITKIIK